MIPLSFDHIVILVADLDRAITDYAGLGFIVRRGGTHAAGTTRNALVVFEDGSYLELITFLAPDPAHRWSEWARRGHEGFVDWALCPAVLEEAVQAARAHGVSYREPVDGGRVRPDGAVLRWRICAAPSAALPFLCADVTSRALRVPEGDLRVHPNGARGIGSVVIAVTELASALRDYRALLGCDPNSVAGANTGMQEVRLPLGSGAIVLREDAVACGRTQASRIDGIRHLALRGCSAAQLPIGATHGASIEIVRG